MVPVISIGLPVYNGENYLAQSIESILDQTCQDFELIISDNASTDNTEAICRAFAEKSDKIRYFRQDENIGASGNFEFAFQQARGTYFRWQAHDDYAYPQLLEKCLARLQAEPDAVLCFSEADMVDADGNHLKIYSHADFDTTDPDPIKRFAGRLRSDGIVEVFGLMPRAVLGRIERLGPFYGNDRCLLAHLALMGRFLIVPEVLYGFRVHAEQYSEIVHSLETNRSSRVDEKVVGFDPQLAKKPALRRWTLLLRSLGYLHTAKLSPWARLRGYFELARAQRHRRNWRWLLREIRLLIMFEWHQFRIRRSGT